MPANARAIKRKSELNENINVRAMARADLHAIARVLDDTGLFPAEMLAEMAEPWLAGQAPHHWLVAEREGEVIGFGYCEPERMTIGTFNLLAIAVRPELQGQGVGTAIIAALESRLGQSGGRVLIVETSSLPDYAATRAFYDGLGFAREARIRDFYDTGEDKILFWKQIG